MLVEIKVQEVKRCTSFLRANSVTYLKLPVAATGCSLMDSFKAALKYGKAARSDHSSCLAFGRSGSCKGMPMVMAMESNIGGSLIRAGVNTFAMYVL